MVCSISENSYLCFYFIIFCFTLKAYVNGIHVCVYSYIRIGSLEVVEKAFTIFETKKQMYGAKLN